MKKTKYIKIFIFNHKSNLGIFKIHNIQKIIIIKLFNLFIKNFKLKLNQKLINCKDLNQN